jgi:excisionase family DNA binding protein
MAKLISTAEAAERLGVTKPRVHQLINAGRLPALRIGRTYAIDEADLKKLGSRKPGRPRTRKQRKAA